MTAEEMEVAYCKARRSCMKYFRMWLREHLTIADEAKKLKLNHEQIYRIIIASMDKAEKEISKELDNAAELLSDIDKKTMEDSSELVQNTEKE